MGMPTVSCAGAARPGELLSGPAGPLSQEQAQALAIDLARRSTSRGRILHLPARHRRRRLPVEAGLPQLRQVRAVRRRSFVLARKREQWYSLAERAPDEATAAWLHQVFAPPPPRSTSWRPRWPGSVCSTRPSPWTCAARRDYFQRIWNTGFRAAELIRTTENGGMPGDDPGKARDELEATA
jgi:hypothetical protein